MTNAGSALMGIGIGVGENRAQLAARQATASPLLEVSMEGARGVLFNIIGGADLSMSEVNEASKIISQAADPDANIIFGATIDQNLHDQIRITVIATGFDESRKKLQEMVEQDTGQQDQQQQSLNPFAAQQPRKEEEEESIFGIPAFLRQKN